MLYIHDLYIHDMQVPLYALCVQEFQRIFNIGGVNTQLDAEKENTRNMPWICFHTMVSQDIGKYIY